MKLFMRFICALFCLVTLGIASGAEAVEYEIQPGDNLTKISTTWGTTIVAIVDANTSITNPDIIYVGQTISIPEMNIVSNVATVIVARSTDDKVFLWKKPGGNKCIKCNATRFIEKNYPNDVTTMLAEKVIMGDYTIIGINSGDHFDAMLFGKNKTVRNVVATFTDGHVESAREYAIELEGKRYALILPDICGNWAKQVTDAPIAPPTQAIAVAPIEQAPPIPPPEPEAVCKTCPQLRPAFIFPALPDGSPIENADIRNFYNKPVTSTKEN